MNYYRLAYVILSFLLAFAIQWIICIKLKNILIKLIPIIFFTAALIVPVIIAILKNNRGSIVFIFFALYASFPLAACGMAWGISQMIKHKREEQKRIYLRPYEAEDAEKILRFCTDEKSFYLWTADRYDKYPISPEIMNEYYLKNNGGCESGCFYPKTAVNANGIIGHLIMQYTDIKKKIVRFGFVILDPNSRGKGYGKKMIRRALEHAFNDLEASKVTIGVFDNNPSAYHCYTSVGFKRVDVPPTPISVMGEIWHYIELEYTK